MSFVESTNPRVVIVARVLLGVCQLLPEDMATAASNELCSTSNANRLSNVFTNDATKQRVDSFTNPEKSYFIKTHVNEVYPESILIYRDKEGPSDRRSSRITELSKRYIIYLLNRMTSQPYYIDNIMEAKITIYFP